MYVLQSQMPACMVRSFKLPSRHLSAILPILVTLLPVALGMIPLLVAFKLTLCLEDLGMMFFLVIFQTAASLTEISSMEERAMTYCGIATVMQRCLAAQVMT